jgi:hypothetical protein
LMSYYLFLKNKNTGENGDVPILTCFLCFPG